MKFDWLKAADPKLEVAPSCRARGLKLVSKSLCHSHADGRALMKGAGIEIGFGPLRSAPSALRVQQNEVLAVLTAWDDVFSRSGAVFPGRGRVSSGVLPRCRLGCEDSSCQNLVFAAHRRASAVKPILTCAAVRRLLCRGAGDRAGRAPGRRPKRASEPPASPRGTARPGYVNIGLTAEPCESVHPWTERGGAPSRVSVAG